MCLVANGPKCGYDAYGYTGKTCFTTMEKIVNHLKLTISSKKAKMLTVN